jgi:hypothetical protein
MLVLATLAVPHTASADATAPAACTGSGGLKPLIRGLVDRNGIPPAPDLQATAIDVRWSDLEPDPVKGLVHPNAIDAAIAELPCSTPLRLRVLAGISAPRWVKDLDGGAVSVINPFGTTTGTIGRFWTEDFKYAYDKLQAELALAYDSAPNLDEVVVSRCSMFYPEPFLRGTSIQSNIDNLVNAGYTVALDKQCQTDEIDSVANHWTTARVGVAFNPYQVVNPDKTASVDESYTEQMMAYCRNTYLQRCVLENDSIRDPLTPTLTPDYLLMYAAMSALGAPIAFQTAVKPRYGDFWGTLVWARQHHAASVELPLDGTYPTSGGTGAPTWQTLGEVARWFQEDPAITATPLAAVEGQATTGLELATLNLDELAAVDTMAGYGDVGSVPFDTVSASVHWPDGATEAALLSTGSGGAAVSVTCPEQQACSIVIESGGHVLAEEAAPGNAVVDVTPALGTVTYVPADGIPIEADSGVSAADAALSLVKLRAAKARHPLNVRLTLVFADADPGGLGTDYTVTISWGDQSTTVLSAAAVIGGFSARTTHAYSSAGTYRWDVAISDAGGSTLDATKKKVVVG